MTDTATETAPAAEAPAEKPAKVVVPPHACLCQQYRLVAKDDKDSVFATECGQTTKSVFAQGHDARLVSFLVDGHFDDYQIRRIADGNDTQYNTPAEAVAGVSEKLREKAEKATANRQAKEVEKTTRSAEREAKKADAAKEREAKKAAAALAKEQKAAAPKVTGAEVAAGSTTGDVAPLAEGQVRIKVGRWEYVADRNEDGGVTFVDGKGETQVRGDGDGYTVLEG